MKMQKYVCIDQMLEIDITADDVSNLLQDRLKELSEREDPDRGDFITPINAVFVVLSGYSQEMIALLSKHDQRMIYSELLKQIERWRPDDWGMTPKQPGIRGSEIKRSGSHDAGAYAMCSSCGRYSDHPKSLLGIYPCDCGKVGYWSGSFKPPTSESQWSESRPTQQ